MFWKYSETFHQQPENIQRLFINNPETFKDFFACKFVLAANHQQPENIQRLFRLQICLSRKSSTSRKYSKTSSPATCLSRRSSTIRKYSKTIRLQLVLAANHQLHPGIIQRPFGQQQSTTATSSNNQHQQPAATINSSNQQQQSTAATSSSNHQQQPAASVLLNASKQSTTTSVSYNYGS